MSEHDPQPNPIGNFLRRLPIIGYASRCIDEAKWGQLAFLVANLIMALVVAIIFWGGSVIIIVAELGALLMFLIKFAIAGGG
jgi:hypothetical protein